MRIQLLNTLLFALALSLPLESVEASGNYPNKPVTIIVPYTPGDGPDVIARLIGEKISKRLGQPVLIDNKAGASGQIGLTQTAQADADGYTLGVGLVTNLALAPHAYKSLRYDPLKDFQPVALATMNYLALVSRPNAPFKDVKEMISWAKANPGKLTIGTTSSGGLPHMSFELLAYMAGFNFMNIPYKGNGPVVNDLLGGTLDLAVTSYTSVAQMVSDGRLNLLGITYPERDPSLAALPAIGEEVKGYSSVGWFGFVAPKGTSQEIVNRLNKEINWALEQPDVIERMNKLGLIPIRESPQYFGNLLKSENEKFAKLVKDIGYEQR